MASPERYRVYALLNFVGVPLTKLGYTPGWAGLGQDLPKGVFLQWVGWVISQRYLFDDPNSGPGEFSEIQGRATRAVHVRRSLGDAARGRIAVFGVYLDRARDLTSRRPMPARADRPFGFFRPEHRDTLWRGAAEWIQAAK